MSSRALTKTNPGRLRTAVAAIAVLLAALGAATALAGKSAERVIGSQGTAGGLFDDPADVAVDESTGRIYVADSGNDRIQRLGADGSFELAWGRDVIAGGEPGDLGSGFEICGEATSCKAGGTGAPAIGGQLDAPRSIAVNQDSGDVYVLADSRISQFDADGNFIRLWGGGVVEAGGTGDTPTNEEKTFGFPDSGSFGVKGGNFTLTFEGEKTAPIAWNADATAVQSALEALPNVDPGEVSVTRPAGTAPDWSATFGGRYADAPVALSGENHDLIGPFGPAEPGYPIRMEATMAAGGFEICAVASECRGGTVHGTGAGQIGGLGDVAVGPAGDVFLADTKNARIQQFEADGDFVRAWGWGVDTDNGWGVGVSANSFQVCTAASRCMAGRPQDLDGFGSPTMAKNGQFLKEQLFTSNLQTGAFPTAIAVSPSGVVYASNASTHFVGSPDQRRIDRFDSGQSAAAALLLPNPIRSQNSSPAGPLPDQPAPADIEIDPGSGHLYYLSSGIREIDPSPNPATLVDTHFTGSDGTGFGYGAATGRFLVATTFGGHRLVVVGSTPAPPPVVSLDPPEVTGQSEATFSGEVTPNGPAGIRTGYRFEYKKVSSTEWTRLPTGLSDVGDGPDPVAVSQSVSTLEAGSTYEVRLHAEKEFGAAAATSPPLQFSAGDLPPDVETLFPQWRSDTEATFSGRINPHNLETTYHFEYGTDAGYGQVAPVPSATIGDSDEPRLVAVQVQGLEPETEYHYRLVADNGTPEAPGDTTIEGVDVAFTTRSSAEATPPARAFEMVSPPFKVVRGVVRPGGLPGYNPQPGLPSLSGDTFLWQIPFFPLTDDVGWSSAGDQRIIRRTDHGWVGETLNTLPLPEHSDPYFASLNPVASSGDLATQAVEAGVAGGGPGNLLPGEAGSPPNRSYLRRLGTGFEGYSPRPAGNRALLNDDGTAMVSGTEPALQRAIDPDALPVSPRIPLNECSGGAGEETQLPTRNGSGVPSDTIGARPCEAGAPVSGSAGIGGESSNGPTGGSAATALSGDGRRVFFTSPSPTTSPASCSAATGAATACPSQLFVHQLGAGGERTVRWVSQSRSHPTGEGNGFDGPMIAGQEVAEMGAGAGFQGASRDGRYVYFKTNAPLVPTDPNGGSSITAGAASESSWDLYRYELPQSLDADPAGGVLTRISGGPAGDADPSTNAKTDQVAGFGGALRYLSDDGERAYFVTTSPIAGADGDSPAGGATTPGGTVGNLSSRNLYQFDGTRSGADRYRFIARIPFDRTEAASGSSAGDLNACASSNSAHAQHLFAQNGHREGINPTAGSCFHGTADGSHVTFFTAGRLTVDDNDSAGDIYLYDAEADELTRVTAPPADAEPYLCNQGLGGANGVCHGDFGWAPFAFHRAGHASDQDRGFGGMRYSNIAKDAEGEVSVFFESRSELVPEDSNGDHWDVYEWHEGELSLVSRGLPGHHSYFSGNSVDGRDVFLVTSDRIDPRELDPNDYDVYDARVGGGFPFTPPAQPCDVLAFACEREATLPAPVAPKASQGFAGPGNVAPRGPSCRKGKRLRKGRCVRVRKGAARGKHRADKPQRRKGAGR